MNDLFEKLKAEPPVKICKNSTVKRINDDIDESPLATPPPPRCMSTPPSSPSPVSAAIVKKDEISIKSEISTPPKHVNPSGIRAMKIRIKRCNITEIGLKVPSQKTVSPDAQKHRKRKGSQNASSSCGIETRPPTKRTKSSKIETKEDAPFKNTPPPTKAQQKLFELPQQKHTQPRLKQCKVRVQRLNLLALQHMFSKQTVSTDKSRISSVVKTDCEKTIEPTMKTSAMNNATLMGSPLNQSISTDKSRISSAVKTDCEKTIEPTMKTSAMNNATLMDSPLNQSISTDKSRISSVVKTDCEKTIEPTKKTNAMNNAPLIGSPLNQSISTGKSRISSFVKTDCEKTIEPTMKSSAMSNATPMDHPLNQSTDSKRKLRRSFFIKLPTKKPESTGDERRKKSVERAKCTRNAPALKKHNELDHCHLVNTFGKRFFAAHVRIQRCRHSLVLAIEANERTCMRKTRQSKPKSLSVSFKDTVEVLGEYTDEEEDIDKDEDTDEDQQETERHPPSGQIDFRELYLGHVGSPRKKNMENSNDSGDDNALDASLTESIASTSIVAAGRKRSPRKSYSPLKDDTTPSPRRERLKLANEKVPPAGMLIVTIMDDDDEDEYIVPDVIQSANFKRNKVPASVEGDESKQKEPANTNGTALDTSKSGSDESFATELETESSISAQEENGQKSNSKIEETAISQRTIVVTTAIDVDDEMSTKANSDDELKTNVNDDHLSKMDEDKDLNESFNDDAEESPIKVNERESPHNDRDDATTAEKECFVVCDNETTTNGLTKITRDGETGVKKDVPESLQETDDDETSSGNSTSSPQKIKDDETIPRILSLSLQQIRDDETAANNNCESDQVIIDLASPPEIYDDVNSPGNLSESPQKVNDNETGMKDSFESPKSVNDDENVENKSSHAGIESACNSSSSYVSAEEIEHLHDLLSADQDSPNPANVSAQLLDDNQSDENLAVSETDELPNCALIGSEHLEGTVHSNNRSSSIERELSLHLFVEDEENESVDEIVKDTINKLGQDIELEDDSGSHAGDDEDNPPSVASQSSVLY